ncbi:MAG: protein translocase subunit SecF [Tropicimonas sp.]|uniref:protein translocase subunit SecF n=1 Tax=Tropicimonas sp. TaxID=2067044 RepID=UPI003A88F023
MRLKLVPDNLNWNYFKYRRLTFGASTLGTIGSVVLFFVIGLNFGIDFLGGTTIRTESPRAVDVGAYRQAIAPIGLGDVSITQVYDASFDENQHVAQIRIQQQEGDEAITPETIEALEVALTGIDPQITFPSVESVGPKVSNELIWTAVQAVVAAILAILVYIWLRFEWQFGLGAVVSLIHDVTMTIGVFCLLQIRFDLTVIAALLTIVGYSINDTVIVFDRVRENLRRYKAKPLEEVLDLSVNETMSRTVMTSGTTLIALIALYVLGGDVIRGFVFAMIWGILVGTYSSIFVASPILLWLGVKRDWSKPSEGGGTQFGNVDA